MDNTNLTAYCEYNARKAAEKRHRLKDVARAYVWNVQAIIKRQYAESLGLVVHEHDASPSIRQRIRNYFGSAP